MVGRGGHTDQTVAIRDGDSPPLDACSEAPGVHVADQQQRWAHPSVGVSHDAVVDFEPDPDP